MRQAAKQYSEVDEAVSKSRAKETRRPTSEKRQKSLDFGGPVLFRSVLLEPQIRE